MTFTQRLAKAVRHRRSQVCVGIDPRFASLPTAMTAGIDSADWKGQAASFETFSKGIIDVVADLVPVVKPQAAFFEQLGPDGMWALKNVIDYASQKGLLVILDGKRNDIGTTAQAYAEAYLGANGKSPWGADSLTVSPYLGEDSLTPFVEVCRQRDAGIFVLVKTSNKGSGFLQDQLIAGAPIYDKVAGLVESLNAGDRDPDGFGAVGAVVGATYPSQLIELRAKMPSAWILVPGFGAQGGTAEDVKHGFRPDGLGAVVNSSRGIIFAYQDKKYAHIKDWQKAVEQATQDMNAQLRGVSGI